MPFISEWNSNKVQLSYVANATFVYAFTIIVVIAPSKLTLNVDCYQQYLITNHTVTHSILSLCHPNTIINISVVNIMFMESQLARNVTCVTMIFTLNVLWYGDLCWWWSKWRVWSFSQMQMLLHWSSRMQIQIQKQNHLQIQKRRRT